MNDYIETRLEVSPCTEVATDILAAMLADAGYESFVPDATGLTAYVRSELHNPTALAEVIANFPLTDITVTTKDDLIEGRDWNAEWEQNYFQPLVIGNECVIHSSFHKDYPKCRYEIVIDPKMAFGTGHHSTTSLIVRSLLSMDLKARKMLDMGTGTGILAMLGAMRGANPVIAVEIDEFAHVNALENVQKNHHPEIEVRLGDVSKIANVKEVEVLTANINRNVITADLPGYVAALALGADVLLSGFYAEDVAVVEAVAHPLGLATVNVTTDKNWACLHLKYHGK